MGLTPYSVLRRGAGLTPLTRPLLSGFSPTPSSPTPLDHAPLTWLSATAGVRHATRCPSRPSRLASPRETPTRDAAARRCRETLPRDAAARR
ncbi:hypothetical protein MTIV3_ORF1, partial [Metallosphaera turreted icosahedral virus 3]